MKFKKIDKKIVITAIICLAAVEAWALYLGFNGQLMRWMFVIIAGLAGLTVPSPISK